MKNKRFAFIDKLFYINLILTSTTSSRQLHWFIYIYWCDTLNIYFIRKTANRKSLRTNMYIHLIKDKKKMTYVKNWSIPEITKIIKVTLLANQHIGKWTCKVHKTGIPEKLTYWSRAGDVHFSRLPFLLWWITCFISIQKSMNI